MNISFVVQENNFREMKKFVEMKRKHRMDNIHFSKLNNRGTYSKKEYKQQAIHLKSHPNHEEFLNRINDPLFVEDHITLGNLFVYRK